MVAGQGHLCVDFYEKSLKTYVTPKYWLRPLTTRMDKAKLLNLIRYAVPFLLPISNKLAALPFVGHYLRHLIPIANYKGILPLSKQQLEEWSVLDTFDWLSAAYDNPQTGDTVHNLFEEANLTNIEVLKAGHLVGRGIKNDPA